MSSSVRLKSDIILFNIFTATSSRQPSSQSRGKKQGGLPPYPVPVNYGWGGWIRTNDGGAKVRCLAAWLHPKNRAGENR